MKQVQIGFAWGRSKMIVVRLIGGLGNQMFQYAFAKELEYVLSDRVVFDFGSYDKYKIRDFSLDKLSTPELDTLSNSGLSKTEEFKFRINQRAYRCLQKAIKLARNNDRVGEHIYEHFVARGLYYNFDPYFYGIPKCNCQNSNVYGYFQGPSYFKDVEKLIRKEFRVSVEPTTEEDKLIQILESCNSVGVSIRCGHGYQGSFLDVCKPEYYYQGMDLLYSRISNPRFFVFSDDVDFVAKNFKFPYEVTYVSNFNDYQSLRLLYSCHHFVIANSTFSWWGSFLGTNENKLIVAPKQWRKNSSGIPDIYSSNFDFLI